MRIRLRTLLLGTAVALLALSGARAQTPAGTPDPTAPPNSAPNEYPDIDALREPGSTAKLFPQQTPDPNTTGEDGQTLPRRNGRRGGGLPGAGQPHRRGQRLNDALVAEADADPLEVRVAYRHDKTTAMARDPGLADLLRDAAAAGTDVRKRSVLKVYYNRLFADVRKVDPSPEMRKHVDILAMVAQQRYDPQRRVVGGEEDIIRGGGGRGGRNR